MDPNSISDLRHIRAQGANVGDKRTFGDSDWRWNGESWEKQRSAQETLVNEITSQIIELEDKLAKIPNVTFTTEELDAFMNKALDEITPYYETKKAEIEKGIKEGKVQTAEDTLLLTARVKDEVKNSFAKYDIEQAQTEEEFINKLADITASSAEAVESKKFEWKSRLDTAAMGLETKGIYSSGIGQKQLTDLSQRKQQEFETIQRQTEQSKVESETAKKFSLERVALARQSITDDRNRRIGAPVQTAELEQKAKQEIGLAPDAQIGSEAETAYNRENRATKVYDPTALSSLEEERRQALESTNLSIKKNEEDIRMSEYDSQRKAIQSEIARKQAQVSSYR